MMTSDGLIKLGFWSQLILLVLVDWGSLAAFLREPPPWYHYAGFVAVNVLLLCSTAWMYKWFPRSGSASGAVEDQPTDG